MLKLLILLSILFLFHFLLFISFYFISLSLHTILLALLTSLSTLIVLFYFAIFIPLFIIIISLPIVSLMLLIPFKQVILLFCFVLTVFYFPLLTIVPSNCFNIHSIYYYYYSPKVKTAVVQVIPSDTFNLGPVNLPSVGHSVIGLTVLPVVNAFNFQSVISCFIYLFFFPITLLLLSVLTWLLWSVLLTTVLRREKFFFL